MKSRIKKYWKSLDKTTKDLWRMCWTMLVIAILYHFLGLLK